MEHPGVWHDSLQKKSYRPENLAPPARLYRSEGLERASHQFVAILCRWTSMVTGSVWAARMYAAAAMNRTAGLLS